MKVFDAIIQRRSYRGEYKEHPIDDVDLNHIIEAARWTPSPFNVQPWELLIIKEPKGKDVLANMTENAVVEQFKDLQFLDDNSQWMSIDETEWKERGDGVLLTDHITLPKLFQEAPKKLTGSILKGLVKNTKTLSILGHLGAGKLPAKDIAAQVREAPLLILITMNTQRKPPGKGANRWMWLSVGMLIQNMLLAATALGIGVQFVSAPLESDTDRDKIRKHFNIPDYHEVMTLLRLGYVDSDTGDSVRLETEEFIHYEEIS